ncbi:MAG: hypothetical protein HY234_10620 [Acidobacteria bacterium]|nr:hypothetical protein [Acidobacteriota bacterium]
MRRASAFTLATLLFVGLSLAAPQAAKKEGALRCTLTNKVIEKCCCEQKDGKTYCPLAKKSVEKCCCEPAAAKAKAAVKKG